MDGRIFPVVELKLDERLHDEEPSRGMRIVKKIYIHVVTAHAHTHALS